MECNKDEAARAKEIAVKKFTEKDIAGAKKFALKAQNLFPELEGLPQLLATLEVYIASEKRINGVNDWYGVLGVDPLADDDSIRKSYRRLALILHPDKNKSVGADGAFKILSEAWSLLSDTSRKIAYDQKRNLRATYQNGPTAIPSVPAGNNGFRNFNNSNNSFPRTQQNDMRKKTKMANPNTVDQQSGARPNTTSPPCISKPNTFWTVCSGCKMQYEYLRKYLNHTLVCPKPTCREAFCAVEILAPSNGSAFWHSNLQGQNTTNINSNAPPNKHASFPNVGPATVSGINSFNADFRSGVFSNSVGVQGTQASVSSAAQSARAFQMPSEKLNKGREEAQAAVLKREALGKKFHVSKKTGPGLASGSSPAVSGSVHRGERPIKKRRIDGRETANQIAVGNRGTGVGISQKGNSETERVSFSGSNRPNSTRDLSQLENRNMLMKKARTEIGKKLNQWKTAAALNSSDDLDISNKEKGAKEKDTGKAIAIGVKHDAKKPIESKSMDTKNRGQTRKSSPAISDVVPDTEGIESTSMSVPDPDFHDFDKDRTEKSFGVNQVWAVYDDDDGMPRYYAMIHSVISLKPFKMRISWLNSKSNSELAPLNWVGSGFPKTCGDLRIGKHEVNKTLNSFSHKVKWTKGARGAIQIYPTKGEVWALYRNWSADWNELTPDEVIHKYDMVEVLEDYDEERGVTVAPLVKVAGFKTVFHQHLDPGKYKTIRREELFRFSHQVPSYLLTGQEAPTAPEGCRELDPAATPLELLKVITGVKEEEMVDSAENGNEDLSKNVERTEM